MRAFAVVAIGLALASSAHAQGVPAESTLDEHVSALSDVRQIAAAVLSGDAEKIVARSHPDLITAMGGFDKLRSFIQNLPKQTGKETALDHDRLLVRVRGPSYSRIARMEKGPPIRLDMFLDAETALITSLTVKPARDKGVHVLPRAAKTILTLPFGMPRHGHVWRIGEGGADVIDNYHTRPDTYYAIDVSPRPLNSPAPPASPSNAPCWDLPIKAAAPGMVVIAQDGMLDEPKLGTNSNPEGGPGNHVIVDHRNGEFTLYAHLRQGTIIVKPGEAIARGQEVGRCGNSASNGPHLHFQLMDGSDLDTARGIPPVFHDYFAPLRYIERGTLVAGDVVLPTPSAKP